MLAFVDDISAMIINDGLCDGDRPLLVSIAGGDGQLRGEMYLDAALGVVRYFGHSEALAKTWFPGQSGAHALSRHRVRLRAGALTPYGR